MKTENPTWLIEARKQFNEQAQTLFAQELSKKRKEKLIQEKEYAKLFTEKQPEAEKTRVNFSSENSITCFRKVFQQEKYLKIIKEHLSKTEYHDMLSARNIAQFTQAYFIHITKEQNEEELLQLEYLFGKNSTIYIFILVDEGVKVSFIEHIREQDVKKACSTVDIHAGKNAQVHFSTVQDLKEDFYYFASRNIFIEENAQVHIHDGSLGAKLVSIHSATHLLKQGAKGFQKGSFFVDGNSSYYITQKSFHYAPATSSDITTKSVVQDKAQANFDGLVRMFAPAQKAKGFENINVLHLSPDAHVRAIPNLEIDTADVECSHGASIGQMNPEDVFYLQSRGLNIQQSKKLLIQGFFTPQLEASSLSKTEQQALLEHIAKKLD